MESVCLIEIVAQLKIAMCGMQPVQKEAQGEPGKRLYMMTEVAIGTWWFDREILNALTSPAVSSTRGWLSARLRNSARGAMGPPRQVVVLGAGLDTRPWRLPLPKQVKWLEVDNAEVVQAKRHRLDSLNVQTEPVEHVGFHPLRCSEWFMHAADLSCGQDWESVLGQYGFDASLPIVWVIEGVLMYLSQESVHELLQDLAKVSCPGSTLIGSSTVNRNAELFGGNNHDVACGSYPAEAVDVWISSLPHDPTVPLFEAGWSLGNSCLLAEIAHDVCKGDPEGKCTFDTELQIDDKPTEVYFVAKKK